MPYFISCSLRFGYSVIFNSFQQGTNLLKKNKFSSAVWGSKKKHRSIKLDFPFKMTDPKLEEELAPLRAKVKEQVCYIYFPYASFFNFHLY